MVYDPDKHHRKSIRLKCYDYTKTGYYFVTICINQREFLLGKIVNGEMYLNEAGAMVQKVWSELNIYYQGIIKDAFVIMPNHIHGIIFLQNSNVGAGPCACPHGRLDQTLSFTHQGQPQGVAPTLSLSDIIHRFKTLTTKLYADGVKQRNWKRFYKKLWQRNYYEHIIKNENRLLQLRNYINNNPLKWDFDRENPNEKSEQEKKDFWKTFLNL